MIHTVECDSPPLRMLEHVVSSSEIEHQKSDSPRLLECAIRDYLATNLGALGIGPLTLIGTEYQVPSGRIDILAAEQDGTKIAIELKRGVASREAVGQLQAYIGDLLVESGKHNARGLLIASGFDQGALSAVRASPYVEFFNFELRFAFKPVAINRPAIVAPREPLPNRAEEISRVLDRRFCLTCKINVSAQRRSDGKFYCNTCDSIV